MAMPTRETAVTTIEDLLALPDDGKRHELLDGVHVVTPAPEYPHQGVLGGFSVALGKALEGPFTSPLSRRERGPGGEDREGARG